MTVTARLVRDAADLAAAYEIRRTVFTVGQGVPRAIERDDADATAVHALGLRNGEPVGAGRLVDRGAGVATVGRMAVLEPARGRGVGAAVLRLLERTARERGYRRLELHAQVPARRFYARAGYAETGPQFVEADLWHIAMVKDLPVVREVRDEDGPGLAALIESCWAEYPGCVLDIDAEEPWLRAPRTAYDRAGGRMWVVEQGPALVACCGVKTLRRGVVELKSMYVARAARRQGLARQLEGLVLAEARARGASRVELWSDTRFLDAHTTYAALGYQRLPGSRDLHDLSHTTEWPFAKTLG